MVSQRDDDSISSSDSTSDCFEIRFRDKPTHLSPLTNKQEVFKLSTSTSHDKPKCLGLKEDVVCAEHERVSYTKVADKEKNEDDLCVLENALEVATTSFQGLSEYQKKKMFGNLKKLGVKRRRELSDEWKALVVEELQLKIKKQTFAGELANALIY